MQKRFCSFKTTFSLLLFVFFAGAAVVLSDSALRITLHHSISTTAFIGQGHISVCNIKVLTQRAVDVSSSEFDIQVLLDV